MRVNHSQSPNTGQERRLSSYLSAIKHYRLSDYVQKIPSRLSITLLMEEITAMKSLRWDWDTHIDQEGGRKSTQRPNITIANIQTPQL